MNQEQIPQEDREQIPIIKIPGAGGEKLGDSLAEGGTPARVIDLKKIEDARKYREAVAAAKRAEGEEKKRKLDELKKGIQPGGSETVQ